MSSIQDRLQLKRVPLDNWSIREKLGLASAVSSNGDQNWMSVSRLLKLLYGTGRPNDWFSQRSCAAQYDKLLENVDTPKRKKKDRGDSTQTPPIESPSELILKKLLLERQDELERLIQESRTDYNKIRDDITKIQNTDYTEEQLLEMWSYIEKENVEVEKRKKQQAQWLSEREERQKLWEKNSRTTNASYTFSSPTTKLPQTVTSIKDEVMETIDTSNTAPTHIATTSSAMPITPTPSSRSGVSPLLTSLLKSPSPAPNNNSMLHTSMGSNLGAGSNINTLSNSRNAPTIANLLTSGTNSTSTTNNSNNLLNFSQNNYQLFHTASGTILSHPTLMPSQILLNQNAATTASTSSSSSLSLTAPLSSPVPTSSEYVPLSVIQSPSQSAPTLSMLLENKSKEPPVINKMPPPLSRIEPIPTPQQQQQQPQQQSQQQQQQQELVLQQLQHQVIQYNQQQQFQPSQHQQQFQPYQQQQTQQPQQQQHHQQQQQQQHLEMQLQRECNQSIFDQSSTSIDTEPTNNSLDTISQSELNANQIDFDNLTAEIMNSTINNAKLVSTLDDAQTTTAEDQQLMAAFSEFLPDTIEDLADILTGDSGLILNSDEVIASVTNMIKDSEKEDARPDLNESTDIEEIDDIDTSELTVENVEKLVKVMTESVDSEATSYCSPITDTNPNNAIHSITSATVVEEEENGTSDVTPTNDINTTPRDIDIATTNSMTATINTTTFATVNTTATSSTSSTISNTTTTTSTTINKIAGTTDGIAATADIDMADEINISKAVENDSTTDQINSEVIASEVKELPHEENEENDTEIEIMSEIVEDVHESSDGQSSKNDDNSDLSSDVPLSEHIKQVQQSQKNLKVVEEIKREKPVDIDIYDFESDSNDEKCLEPIKREHAKNKSKLMLERMEKNEKNEKMLNNENNESKEIIISDQNIEQKTGLKIESKDEVVDKQNIVQPTDNNDSATNIQVVEVVENADEEKKEEVLIEVPDDIELELQKMEAEDPPNEKNVINEKQTVTDEVESETMSETKQIDREKSQELEEEKCKLSQNEKIIEKVPIETEAKEQQIEESDEKEEPDEEEAEAEVEVEAESEKKEEEEKAVEEDEEEEEDIKLEQIKEIQLQSDAELKDEDIVEEAEDEEEEEEDDDDDDDDDDDEDEEDEVEKKVKIETVMLGSDDDKQEPVIVIEEMDDLTSADEQRLIDAIVKNSPTEDHIKPIESKIETVKEETRADSTEPTNSRKISSDDDSLFVENKENLDDFKSDDGNLSDNNSTIASVVGVNSTLTNIEDTDDDQRLNVVKQQLRGSGRGRRDYTRTRKSIQIEKTVEEYSSSDDSHRDKEKEKTKMSTRLKLKRERSESPYVDELNDHSLIPASIASVSGNILPTVGPTTPAIGTGGRRKRRYSSIQTIDSPASTTSEELLREDRAWKKSILMVYNRIAQHKHSAAFLKNIPEEYAGRYNTIILKPMNLQMIKQNIDSGTITTTTEFQRDIMLMYINTVLFNCHEYITAKAAKEFINHANAVIERVLNTRKLKSQANSPAIPPATVTIPAAVTIAETATPPPVKATRGRKSHRVANQ